MDQQPQLPISKKECQYVVFSLSQSIEQLDKQRLALIKMSIPGESNVDLLESYYNRRRLDLTTLIEKYKKLF